MVRAPYYDKNGVKKGAWSNEEDQKLRNCIRKYGERKWCEIPKFAGLSRCGKSCRLRWVNYLKPNVRRGNYSREEEDVIIKLHGNLGSKWSMIAAELPGRTDNEIKNYWHTHLKNRDKKNRKAGDEKEKQIMREWEGERNNNMVASNIGSDDNYQILESSPILSPQHHQIIPEAESPEQARCVSSEETIITTFVDDFWAGPGVVDSDEYLAPPYAFYNGDTYDMDLIYQVQLMQELPGIEHFIAEYSNTSEV